MDDHWIKVNDLKILRPIIVTGPEAIQIIAVKWTVGPLKIFGRRKNILEGLRIEKFYENIKSVFK